MKRVVDAWHCVLCGRLLFIHNGVKGCMTKGCPNAVRELLTKLGDR